MRYSRIHAASTVEVGDHKALLAAWEQYGGPFCVVARFFVRKPLTKSQFSRLPAGLRARMGAGDAGAWLDGLFALEDSRIEA